MSGESSLPETGKIRDYGLPSLEHLTRELSGLRSDIGQLVQLVRDELKPAISGLADRVSRIEIRMDDRDTYVDRELAAIRDELAAIRDTQPAARRRRARRKSATAVTTKAKSARPKLRR